MISAMIVDDERISREGIRDEINWEHYQIQVVATAINGQDGMRQYQIHHPDLIITDIRMPVMDGLEMIHRIRMAGGQDTIILVLSAFGEFEYAQEAIRNGVFDYLIKPIDDNQFDERLTRVHEKFMKQVLPCRAARYSGAQYSK